VNANDELPEAITPAGSGIVWRSAGVLEDNDIPLKITTLDVCTATPQPVFDETARESASAFANALTTIDIPSIKLSLFENDWYAGNADAVMIAKTPMEMSNSTIVNPERCMVNFLNYRSKYRSAR
jgi:hypothetical protein